MPRSDYRCQYLFGSRALPSRCQLPHHSLCDDVVAVAADVDVDGCVVAFVIAVLGYVSEAKDRRTSLADVRLVNGDENLVYHAIEVAEQCLLLESVESAADKFRTWRRRFGTGIHIFQESEALCRSSDYGGFR